MTDYSNSIMVEYINKVNELRNTLLNNKDNTVQKGNIIKQMKEIHGKAIYDCNSAIRIILDKSLSNLNSADYIKLSDNAVFVQKIHNCIIECENRAFNNNDSILTESSDSVHTDTQNNMAGGSYINTSDYIENIDTTEANRLQSLYTNIDNLSNKNDLELDVDKPTLVLYWADWCPASKRFKPIWDNFVKNSANSFHNLQVIDVNTGKNKELFELAKKIGIEGYPSMAMFCNGSINIATGGRQENEIIQFVKKCMS